METIITYVLLLSLVLYLMRRNFGGEMQEFREARFLHTLILPGLIYSFTDKIFWLKELIDGDLYAYQDYQYDIGVIPNELLTPIVYLAMVSALAFLLSAFLLAYRNSASYSRVFIALLIVASFFRALERYIMIENSGLLYGTEIPGFLVLMLAMVSIGMIVFAVAVFYRSQLMKDYFIAYARMTNEMKTRNAAENPFVRPDNSPIVPINEEEE